MTQKNNCDTLRQWFSPLGVSQNHLAYLSRFLGPIPQVSDSV